MYPPLANEKFNKFNCYLINGCVHTELRDTSGKSSARLVVGGFSLKLSSFELALRKYSIANDKRDVIFILITVIIMKNIYFFVEESGIFVLFYLTGKLIGRNSRNCI